MAGQPSHKKPRSLRHDGALTAHSPAAQVHLGGHLESKLECRSVSVLLYAISVGIEGLPKDKMSSQRKPIF